MEWNSPAQLNLANRANNQNTFFRFTLSLFERATSPQPSTMSAFAASEDPDAQDYSFAEDDPASTTPPIPQEQNMSDTENPDPTAAPTTLS